MQLWEFGGLGDQDNMLFRFIFKLILAKLQQPFEILQIPRVEEFELFYNSAPSKPRPRSLKTEVLLWQRIKCFLSTPRRSNLEKRNNQFWFVFEETSVRKITWYRNAIVFGKLRFQTQRRCFQISPIWREFSESSVFVKD